MTFSEWVIIKKEIRTHYTDMIFYNLFLGFVVLIGAVLNALHLPLITALPSVLGVDVDGSMVLGMGYFYTFVSAFWPIHDLFVAVIFYVGYLAIKISLRLALGHRAPQ